MKTVKILLIADDRATIELFRALLNLADNRNNYKILVTSKINQIKRLTNSTEFNWIIFDGELSVRKYNFEILEQITTIGLNPTCVLFTANTAGLCEQVNKQFEIRIVEKTFEAWKKLMDEVLN